MQIKHIQNKKGLAPMVLLVVIIAIVIGLLFAVKGVQASKQTITSTISKEKTCKVDNVAVSVKGSVFTKDTAFWGVTAEPERIDISEVKAGSSLLGIASEDFTWKINLIDSFTGNVVASDSGSNNHPGGNALIEDKYNLNFFVPDNDCNGRLDDFEGELQFTVRSDNGKESTINKDLSFRNGKFMR